MATIIYAPGAVSPYSTTFTSGVFLCSYSAVPASGSAGPNNDGTNGVYLTYGQTKDIKAIDDSAAVVFIGRKKPVAEMGLFVFRQVHMEFRFPMTTAGIPLYSQGVDAATDVETCLNTMIAGQHGYTALDGTGTTRPQIISYQDARGRVLSGMLQNYDITDLMPNWKQVTVDFIETGTS